MNGVLYDKKNSIFVCETVVILSGYGKDSAILPLQMLQGVDRSDGDLHLLSSYFENPDVCNLIVLGHQ